jgi:ketosteroid isomerase-like protein
MDALWAREVPVACVHPNWNALAGRECVMESWRAILDNPEQPRVFTGAAEAHLLDTVAYVLCRELVAGGALTATNVFTQEDGEWRLTLHHSSPVSV